MMKEAKNISRMIDVPQEKAYAFLSKPENFPQWAAGLSNGIEKKGKDWVAKTPTGTSKIIFSEVNQFGILDHVVFVDPKTTIYMPMRIIQNGTGSMVTITLFRQAEMSDTKYNEDAVLIAKDLETLKNLLEAKAAGGEKKHAKT